MPISLDPRNKPIDVKVQVSTGKGVDIVWSDQHRSHYDFAYLRDLCPCAMCDDERHKKLDIGHVGPQAGPVSSPALPMFKPRPTARAARKVGNYALQFDFSDGHGSGIFSYEYLRAICPCDECARSHKDE